MVVYRSPGADLEFLSEFSDFLSDLVLGSDKVVIVGDFNIHIDVDSDSLKLAFISLLESMGISQKVKEPMHCFNHNLDLVLTHSIKSDNLLVLTLNPVLSDHYLIMFEFNILDVTTHDKRYYSRCPSDNAVNTF